MMDRSDFRTLAGLLVPFLAATFTVAYLVEVSIVSPEHAAVAVSAFLVITVARTIRNAPPTYPPELLDEPEP